VNVFRDARGGYFITDTGSYPGAVDSHHPSPASQHVSSGLSGARRSDRMLV
jgi:hypothetical protein